MNTEATAVASPPAVSARTTLLTLVRRELWEHPALWRVPLIVAGFLAVAAALVSTRATIDVDAGHLAQIGPGIHAMVLNVSQDAFAAVIWLFTAVVVSFYALDCLYAERKDRSILFWKSLPVSDGQTVLSKFLTAMVAAPLAAFVLATASHLIAFAAWWLRSHLGGGLPDLVGWDTVAWLRGELLMFLVMLLAVLWYAPLVAAAMLLSVAVKRSPVLWAFLGPLLLWVADLLVFHTGWVASVAKYRSSGIWDALATRGGHQIVIDEHTYLLHALNWGAAFGLVDLWLGVLAAAALVYAAARVRRYRDDT
ncbi:MAG: ABC-2 transporter permease [Proteobacteria bacterium]|nr:ABC-2 transporter permease [Pseudomonadota bacterium]